MSLTLEKTVPAAIDRMRRVRDGERPFDVYCPLDEGEKHTYHVSAVTSDQIGSDYKLLAEAALAAADADAQKCFVSTAQCLNMAFLADPMAIHTLIVNRVPCNQLLADDPFVLVDKCLVLAGPPRYSVGALGLINAVLAANNLPLVAARWGEKQIDGHSNFIGFCEYTPKEGDFKE